MLKLDNKKEVKKLSNLLIINVGVAGLFARSSLMNSSYLLGSNLRPPAPKAGSLAKNDTKLVFVHEKICAEL